MAPASAAVLLPAAAVALMAMVALQISATTAAAPPPAPIGQPGCDTTCGNVSVPYPFGFGSSRSYWPGLNLTCDTNYRPPRLLLGDGSLRVTEIFLRNSTVRVVRAGSIISATGDFTTTSWNVTFGCAFTEHGYQLSSRNELVVSGCNVAAMLFANIGEKTQRIMGGCATFCTMMDDNVEGPYDMAREPYLDEPGTTGEASNYKFCSTGKMRCCQAPLTIRSLPKGGHVWMEV